MIHSLTREHAVLNSTAAILSWDQETFMPDAAIDWRSDQLAYLSGKAHELATSKAWASALDSAEDCDAADLRELRHRYDLAVKLPTAFVERSSRANSQGQAAWAKAREQSDFSLFAPVLEELVQIAREKADLWGYEDEPYDALLGEYERGAKTSEVASIMDELITGLTPLAREAVEAGKSIPADRLSGHYPIAQQQALNKEIAESLGFDFSAGRIDTTAHPFCTTLGPQDIRLTTRYDETDFTSSLFGVLHEAGHGLYEQGLPSDRFHLPSGQAVSLGIHESQSRLWENHVGRSQTFWEKWLPVATKHFPSLKDVSLESFMEIVHRASYSPIRVESDETTYDLHIALRFQIERQILNGDLAIADIPDAWNSLFEKSFGLRPENDAQGCLQDIHWSMGGLGYFPTYSLGNLNAAQLFQAAQTDASVAAATARADYAPLLTWLQENIHSKGSTLFPQDLMKEATGNRTQVQPHLDHLRRRL